jgi:FMN reductase
VRITAVSAGLVEAGVEAQIDVVEVRDHAHDLVNAELTGMRSAALGAVLDRVATSDALVVVTPVFNAHPAGLFQMFFEVLDKDALVGKPVLIGATGGSARHSLVLDQDLLPMFHYLHALVVPVSVFAATDDWGGSSGLDARIGRAVNALLPLLGVRPGQPPEGADRAAPSDDLTLTADFEQMMRALGH